MVALCAIEISLPTSCCQSEKLVNITKSLCLTFSDNKEGCVQSTEGQPTETSHYAKVIYLSRRRDPWRYYAECFEPNKTVTPGPYQARSHSRGRGQTVPQSDGIPRRLCAQIDSLK